MPRGTKKLPGAGRWKDKFDVAAERMVFTPGPVRNALDEGDDGALIEAIAAELRELVRILNQKE